MKRLLTVLIFVLVGANASFCGILPIAPDAWDDSNLKPEYYENKDSQYPNIGGVAHKAVLFGSSFDPAEGVLAYDKEDGYIQVNISGTVDTSKSGMQTVQYSATDSDGNTVEFERKIYVLPQGVDSEWEVKGRFGSNDVRDLDSSYENTLADNLTFISVDITAPSDAQFSYREIRREWADGASEADNINPPDAAEWDSAEETDFFRDLHIFMDPRVDRWFKISVTVNGHTEERVYGLKGDQGEIFTSPYDNKDYIRLSREVEDPITTADQHNFFAQGVTFGYNWDLALQKKMGTYAQQVTAGNPGEIRKFSLKTELHGEMIFERFFMKNIVLQNGTKQEWWDQSKMLFDHGLGIEKNRTYRRSYQIPISETTTAALQANPREDFIAHVEYLYKYLTDTYNHDRIIVCAPTGIAAYTMYDSMPYTNLDGIDRVGFPYKNSPYFKIEFHRPSLDPKVLNDFRTMPFYGTFSKAKMKHISDHSAPAYYYKQLRELVRMSKICGDKSEIVLQEQFDIIKRNNDGTFRYYALPYVALRNGYIGPHFLNNISPYFDDDWDGDSLSNELEYQIGSNPFNADTDGDWIFDADEYRWGLDINSDDADQDKDGDGITNLNEALYSKKLGFKISTPNVVFQELDSDGNPVYDADGNPVMTTLNADRAEGAWDSDFDSLPVSFEVKVHTRTNLAYKPGVSFTDPDKLTTEGNLSANRIMRYLNGDLLLDDDNDGIDMFTEWYFGLSHDDAADAAEDWDGDGVTNGDEINAGTSFTGDNSAPPVFNASTVIPPVIAGSELMCNLYEYIDAPDTDESFVFTLVNGPQWLSVDSYGNVHGTPDAADAGTNLFTVKVNAGPNKEVTSDFTIEVLASSFPETKSISGTISGDVSAGVTILISGNGIQKAVISDNDGNYKCEGLGKNVIYSVVPELDGYQFTPSEIIVSLGTEDISGADFSAEQLPAQPEYSLNVLNGTGAGSYQAGTRVTIEADVINNLEFMYWSGDADLLDNSENFQTTLLMPDHDVTVRANYRAVYDKTPLSVGNCVLWYDASDVLNNGTVPPEGEVREWVDKSPERNNAMKVDKYPVPVLAHNQLNSKPVMHFEENQFLHFNPVSDIRTVFWVLKENDYSDIHFFLSHSSLYDFHRGAGGLIWDSRRASQFVLNGKTFLDGNEVDGTTENFPLNEFKVMSLVTTGDVAADRLTKDRKFGTRTWKGDIAEIIIYNTPLNDDDRKKIEDYLTTKWITGNNPLRFSVTVEYGSGTGIYEEGETVNINADTPEPGMQFDKWTGDIQVLSDITASSTSFTMPAMGINLTALYKKIENEPTYSVSGAVSGDLSEKTALKLEGRIYQIVNVDSNGNFLFDNVPDGNYILTPYLDGYDFNPQTQTVVVAGGDVSGINFIASATNIPHFSLTVKNGTGSGSYIENDTVTISAAVPSGQVFDKWTGDIQFLDDPDSASAIVTMPGQNVTVTATFKQAPSNTFSISGTVSGDILENVTVAVDATHSSTTASDGKYTISGLADGTYTVTPHLDGYTFTPPDADVTISGSDVSGIDFSAASDGNSNGGSNNAPVAVNDAYNIESDGVLEVNNLSGVLVNDYDNENDILTASLAGKPAHGSLNFNSDGSFKYTPDNGYVGNDSFSYTAYDGLLKSNTAVVEIVVTPAGTKPPTAVGDRYDAAQDSKLVVSVEDGVLSNDLNASGCAAELLDDVSDGTLVLNEDGSFEYTPDPAFAGTDSFKYRIADGAYSSEAVVMLNIVPVKITIGTVLTYKATQVTKLNGAEFIKAPKLYGMFENGKKGGFKKINTSTPSEFSGAWSKKYTLYDKKALKSGYKSYFDSNGACRPVKITVMVKGKTADKVKIDEPIQTVQLVPPVITGISDAGGNELVEASPGDTIVIAGKFFGSKIPKVSLEVNGKLLKCKVDKTGFKYKDYKGKISAMNSESNESFIKVILPAKLSEGKYPLVLDNKIGIATTPEGILPEINIK